MWLSHMMHSTWIWLKGSARKLWSEEESTHRADKKDKKTGLAATLSSTQWEMKGQCRFMA